MLKKQIKTITTKKTEQKAFRSGQHTYNCGSSGINRHRNS